MPSAEMIAYPKIRMEADAMLSSELKLFAQSARYTRFVKRRAKADNSSVAAVVLDSPRISVYRPGPRARRARNRSGGLAPSRPRGRPPGYRPRRDRRSARH